MDIIVFTTPELSTEYWSQDPTNHLDIWTGSYQPTEVTSEYLTVILEDVSAKLISVYNMNTSLVIEEIVVFGDYVPGN